MDINALLAESRPAVLKVARRYARDWSEAEDMAQEAMIRIWGGLAKFRGEAKLSTWVHSVAANTSMKIAMADRSYTAWRRHKPVDLEVYEGARDRMTDGADPESLAIAADTWIAIRQALWGMPPALREALILREIDGMDYSEIAEVQCVPKGTVRSRLHRARAEIEAVL